MTCIYGGENHPLKPISLPWQLLVPNQGKRILWLQISCHLCTSPEGMCHLTVALAWRTFSWIASKKGNSDEMKYDKYHSNREHQAPNVWFWLNCFWALLSKFYLNIELCIYLSIPFLIMLKHLNLLTEMCLIELFKQLVIIKHLYQSYFFFTSGRPIQAYDTHTTTNAWLCILFQIYEKSLFCHCWHQIAVLEDNCTM